MTQTQPNKNGPSIGPSIGAAAAAAAAGSPGASAPKPADKPADAGTPAAAGGPVPDASTADRKPRESKRKVFVVVGTVQEFDSVLQAEKYLNGAEAPTGEYVVLQGARSRTSKKVSLR